jgi:hypothetical protein
MAGLGKSNPFYLASAELGFRETRFGILKLSERYRTSLKN